jgi:hypothetical protein
VTFMARTRWVTVAILAGAALLYGGDKKDQPKPSSAQQVDSGSFGVYIKGQRVVTETFTVQVNDGVSTVKSHLQNNGGPTPISQHTELRMTGSGELVGYSWSDGSGSLTVTPNNDFLLEKIMSSPSAKAAEQPFLMPSTSAILDNNFFIHREVLAWRYLATNCHPEGGGQKCQKDVADFGVLVPQDRTSLRVRMELVGREKVMIHGAERELLRLNLKGEAFSWALWVDEGDKFKLIRVLIADDNNTEVVRD